MMADPISIGVGMYPIACHLLKLARGMQSVHDGMRYAKHDLRKVIQRTNTAAQTYDFFTDTMKKAKKTKELKPMFKNHGKLIDKVERESARIIRKLERITEAFELLRGTKPIGWFEKWIAQLKWYITSKDAVPQLFQDMKDFERTMRTIGILVIVQMLQQAYLKDTSNPILAQLTSFEKMLEIEFNKLQHTQRVLEEGSLNRRASSNQNLEPNDFVREIIQILKKEIPRLNGNKSPDRPSTLDSPSPSISPAPEMSSPITSVSSPPPHNSGDDEFVTEPQVENIPLSKRKVSRRRKTQSEPPPFRSKLSSSSLLSGVAAVEGPVEEIPEEEMEDQDQGHGEQGTCMQMPPFGPPKLSPRPRAGRSSPAYPNPSGGRHDPQGDNFQPLIDSYPVSRKPNGSKISVYGDEGEVPPTHMMGFAGLPPESRRGKRRAD
ncbi:hypothetical protein BJX63DRAFT_143272 [Aspergillus granulosus]|uniref:Uncharacterized protein n=1 Tax=Aspergillus granulosus TaxID=176169 RepID=A0ABR4HLD3_9EURO